MKKNKIFSAIAAITTAAALLSGCFNGVDLSEIKSEVEKYNDTNVTSFTNNYTTYVSVSSSSLKAKTGFKGGNLVYISINSENSIDRNCITDAVSVLSIDDQGVASNAVLGQTLNYNILHYSETMTSGDPDTEIILDVDLSEYDTDYLAVKIDATKLKDVKGILCLNLNNNETLSEETDSFIDTFYVNNATNVISSFMNFDFAPTYSYPLSFNGKYDDDSNFIGFEITTPAHEKSYSTDNGFTVYYYTDEASELAEVYTFQTLAAGEKEWKTISLPFSYAEDTHSYTAVLASESIPAGTKMRYLENLIPGKEKVIASYERPSKLTYKSVKTVTPYNFNNENLTEEDSSGNPYLPTTSTFYPADTATIVSGSTWDKSAFAGDIETLQASCFDQIDIYALTKNGFGAAFAVEFDSTKFGTDNALKATDFKITTTESLGYKAVESETKVVMNNEKGDVWFMVETKDCKYKATDLKLWVGPGTELAENTVNEKQVKFGIPADASKGDASGYVNLY